MKISNGSTWRIGVKASAVALLAAAPVMTLVMAGPAPAPPAPVPADGNRYIGAEQCKNCHKSEKAGNQYEKWTKSKHANAFAVLAGDDAKKVAKEAGIADPQTNDACVKCHVTAFGAKPEHLGKKFDPKQGVQCESCHGPGEKHFKARFAAAQEAEEGAEKEYEPVPEDEIVARPGKSACLACHNKDAPTFKGFCFKKRYEEIGHPDPHKKRTEAELTAMKCDCGDDEKCRCKEAECGDFSSPK